MKITEIETYVVDSGSAKDWEFVKVSTDAGIHGWGEVYSFAGRDSGAQAHVDGIRDFLIGRNPFNIKHFTQVVYDDYAGRRGAMDLYCAVSAIEMALWDIVGKHQGQPVYNLLGGMCRDKMRVYANGWYRGASTPEEYAAKAVETVNAGYSALKFDPFGGPWRYYISKDNEARAVDVVRSIREAVGPKVDLLIEVHRRLAPMHAVRVAQMLEEYKLFWYEEPCPAENLDAIAYVRRSINTPVVTGEALYTKAGFREAFEKGAADIINPDICNVGGILEMKEISAMAEPHFVAVSPHGNGTTIGLGATLQLVAGIPNFVIAEYFVDMEPRARDICVAPLEVENGYITMPQTPGLGVELDEEALKEYPAKNLTSKAPRQYQEEGP